MLKVNHNPLEPPGRKSGCVLGKVPGGWLASGCFSSSSQGCCRSKDSDKTHRHTICTHTHAHRHTHAHTGTGSPLPCGPANLKGLCGEALLSRRNSRAQTRVRCYYHRCESLSFARCKLRTEDEGRRKKGRAERKFWGPRGKNQSGKEEAWAAQGPGACGRCWVKPALCPEKDSHGDRRPGQGPEGKEAGF